MLEWPTLTREALERIVALPIRPIAVQDRRPRAGGGRPRKPRAKR
jgi:hypothetical protein